MKKYKVIMVFIVTVMFSAFYSCQKEDEKYVHTDTTITAIYIRNEVGGVYVQGTIEENKIIFEIPLANRAKLDISKLLIYANIPVSAHVSPGFAGRHDLTSPKQFTVTNDNNEPFTYTLQAIYLDY